MFFTYKRGMVIKVDFSPQVGSEIRGHHFAIILTKHDRNNNELLTVIPLTSKEHKCHVDLGEEIKKSIYDKIEESIQLVLDCKNSTDDDFRACDKVINYYSSLNNQTFAKIHQITTISKKRILKPLNRYDPIRRINVSNQIMDIIDRKIVELFTRFDIKS